MNKKFSYAVVLALAVTACNRTPTATSVLQDAQQAMGNPATIQYSGAGMNAFFGQALTAGEEWPRREMGSYIKTINYDQKSARDEMSFTMPVFGGQMQNMQVNGDKAWNIGPGGPVPQFAGSGAYPVLSPADERQLHIWLTPHGFLKGALASGDATLTEGEGSNVVSFTALGKYKLDGTIDGESHVTRVETTVPNPVLGDTKLVANYSAYRDFNGIQFPGKIQIDQGGFPLWDLDITTVTPNATADIPVPEAVQAAQAPPAAAMTAMLAPGVWHVTGGSHHSVVVEFADYIAVIEAPLNEERSLAVIAEAKKLVPNKPIRYLLTTHHHFDHSGGIRTYVAEGATIVTHQSNVPYFQKTAVAPATIVPDMQGKGQKQPTFEGVADKKVITDGKQTIEIYATAGDTHTNEYTLIYLPGPRILVEADAYSPGPADAPPPPMPPPNAVKLFEEIQRLKLNVATIAPIHGRGAVPIAELRKFIGKA